MTVGELKAWLDNYGDHVEVKMLDNTGELIDIEITDDIAANGCVVIAEDM